MATTASQEIVNSLIEFKSETSATLSALEAKVDGINRRLDVSNDRLAKHEQALQDLRLQESRARIRIDHIEEERQNQLESKRGLRIAMFERLSWLVGATLLALIVHYLGL